MLAHLLDLPRLVWFGIQPIYARKRLDIGWSDIYNIVRHFLFPNNENEASHLAGLEELWSPQQTLVSYTVRSGFDLCLQAYNFSPGSEIIISSITIPDMAHIILSHNLVPIPVDVQDDGSVSAEHIAPLISRNTRAILIAHLFGNRMPFQPIVALARKHKLSVIEDCAEAFCGNEWIGDSSAEISMFSFGMIKTCTALGGALLTVRDPVLLAKVKEIQAQYTRQTSSAFFTKLAKCAVFKILTDHAILYGLFLGVIRLSGRDHHKIIRQLSRSFSPDDLITQIRRQPATPLIQFLRYRIANYDSRTISQRRKTVFAISRKLHRDVQPIGFSQDNHQYWLCPIRVVYPGVLIEALLKAGFDAADGGTSLSVVLAEGSVPPTQAKEMMSKVVYLPIDHSYRKKTLDLLIDTVLTHHAIYSS